MQHINKVATSIKVVCQKKVVERMCCSLLIGVVAKVVLRPVDFDLRLPFPCTFAPRDADIYRRMLSSFAALLLVFKCDVVQTTTWNAVGDDKRI